MGKPNPFETYLSKEDVMHSEIVRILAQKKYRGLFWWHTANEGQRTPFEQFKFKELGGRAGVLDFTFLEETNFSKGLMMEIKWGSNGCTKAQVDFLIQSMEKGYTAAVVYNYASDALDLLDKHLSSGICLPSEGIVLVKDGKESIIPVSDAYKVLMSKKKSDPDQVKVKKLFENRAKAKFGNLAMKKELLFGGK